MCLFACSKTWVPSTPTPCYSLLQPWILPSALVPKQGVKPGLMLLWYPLSFGSDGSSGGSYRRAVPLPTQLFAWPTPHSPFFPPAQLPACPTCHLPTAYLSESAAAAQRKQKILYDQMALTKARLNFWSKSRCLDSYPVHLYNPNCGGSDGAWRIFPPQSGLLIWFFDPSFGVRWHRVKWMRELKLVRGPGGGALLWVIRSWCIMHDGCMNGGRTSNSGICTDILRWREYQHPP